MGEGIPVSPVRCILILSEAAWLIDLKRPRSLEESKAPQLEVMQVADALRQSALVEVSLKLRNPHKKKTPPIFKSDISHRLTLGLVVSITIPAMPS